MEKAHLLMDVGPGEAVCGIGACHGECNRYGRESTFSRNVFPAFSTDKAYVMQTGKEKKYLKGPSLFLHSRQ